MNNNRYTEHCENAIKDLQLFKGLEPFLFVLLTHANNEGVTKAATDEYIQQTLSNPRCPGGLKNIMKLVKNRVIMLELVNTSAENYHAQKSKEFITMIEDIHKSNAYKIYTNTILQYAAQVYEKVKLQQQAEIRRAKKLLWSNEEKIQQLKKQAKDSTNSEAISIGDEIVALKLGNKTLESKLEKIKNVKHLTNKALQAEIESILAKKVEEHRGIIAGGIGTTVGGIIGSIVGSIVPGVGTVVGATVGASVVASVGAQIVGGAYKPAPKAYDECKQQ